MSRFRFVVVLGLLGLLGGALSACALSRPIEEQHPSVQRAPGSVDDSEAAKHDALARTAGADLGCQRIDIVLTFERRYVNLASARYVVEGCGTRALYAETCEAYPSCRYLLLSTVAVPQPRSSASTLVTLPSAAPSAPAPPASVPTAAPSASTPPRFL